MCKVAFGHEVICFEHAFNVRTVDADGDTHDHVLRTLSDAAVEAEKVRPLKSFKPKARKQDELKQEII